MSTYQVNLWGSHPEAGNDDCWTGEDFDNEDAAIEAYRHPTFTSFCPSRDVAWIELVRPDGTHEIRENTGCDPKLREWSRAHRAEMQILTTC